MLVFRISEPALTQALKARLQQFDVGFDDDGVYPTGESVFLTTARDSSPADCRELVAHGATVIVLSPVSRKHECEAYARAGAQYLEMSLDIRPLLGLIREVDGAISSERVRSVRRPPVTGGIP